MKGARFIKKGIYQMFAYRYILKIILTGIFLITLQLISIAQNCPPNIDFESGSFSGWTCYTGYVASVNNENVITFDYQGGPVSNRHTMYSSNPGDGLDEYGDFPKNCPNGSGHSIRLGNNIPGTEAEGVSYDFTIPANANVYNLIYNYAVVFQDPAHLPSEQPRMVIEITNLTRNSTIFCSSFTFFPIGSPLPGFELSNNPGTSTPVWFKRWSAVSINLDGNAGDMIRLLFKTSDCTFRRHFGYAYIDVNTECSDKFEGASFCPDDTTVIVNAPYGYQSYTWYNMGFTQVLGNQQTLTFTPPPASGTTIAVVLVPYDGYGCLDTLYTDLQDTLSYTARAGPDKISCNNTPVQIGSPPKAGWLYKWDPPTSLSDADISNPYASPDTTIKYVLSIQHNGGGCKSTDTVVVKAAVLNNALEVLGKTNWCLGSGDSTVLKVYPADSIQWYKNDVAITGANQQVYRVSLPGRYYAKLISFDGCILSTVVQEVFISSVPVTGFTVPNRDQCLLNNKFNFTNTSTNAVGVMQYKWSLGDGNMATTQHLSYSYGKPGTYTVTLVVSSSDICSDSSSIIINVFPNVFANFSIDPVCVNLPVLPINKTVDTVNSAISYLWDFGNGQTSTLRNPPAQVYNSVGNHIMSLSVSSQQCPFPLNVQKRFVIVDKPATPARYRDEIAVVNLPLSLHARPIGNSAIWKPATYLDNANSYSPVFISNREQLYTIQLTTKSGCVTIDTQLVKINKTIEIYVPNIFTPNDDGRNDFLRPFMIGIKQLNYFKIYNRWGQLMYEAHDTLNGWDGKHQGRPAEMQTVVWMLEGLGADNKIYTAKGTTILLR